MKAFNKTILLALTGILLASCGGQGPSSSAQTTSSADTSSQQGTSSQATTSQGTSSQGTSSLPGTSSQATTSEYSTEESSQASQFVPPEGLGIQDGPILHCFNWSMNNVKANLSAIKDAGFRAVQISPMQPQKDPYNGNWNDQWWKLYQPLGFHVAVNNESSIGNKNDLIAMCKEASKLGIRVVADVVANHLANGGSSDNPYLYDAVRNHEPDIYNNQSQTLHDVNIGGTDDNDLRRTVWGHIGLPDLNTGNKTVQNRVISLLKEYIDCGVTGFRFDAAKHIETPEDGDCASDFWPTVLGAATEYAKQKKVDRPYYYGEILYRCGGGRPFDRYTKYMSVCDNVHGTSVIDAVVSKNLGAINEHYDTGVNADHLVLWSESHDTYSNGSGYASTRNYSDDDAAKAYLVQTTRKDASSLFLARPNGNMGDVGSTAFKSKAVAAINKFHTLFAGKSESISKNEGCFINVRGSGAECGMAVIGINAGNTVTISSSLTNGNYVDLVTNKAYTVANNKVTVTLNNDACVLVPENAVPDAPSTSGPSIQFACDKRVFTDSTTVKVTVTNATTATYTVGSGSLVSFSGSANIPVRSTSNSERVAVKVNASNGSKSSSSTYYVYKTTQSTMQKSLILIDVPTDVLPYVWSWPTGGEGAWYAPSVETGLCSYSFTNPNFLIATFPTGTTEPDWSKTTGKTFDMTLTQQVLEYGSLGI